MEYNDYLDIIKPTHGYAKCDGHNCDLCKLLVKMIDECDVNIKIAKGVKQMELEKIYVNVDKSDYKSINELENQQMEIELGIDVNVEEMSPVEMAEFITNHLNMTWLKFCEKKKAEADAKDESGLANWWNKVKYPAHMTGKESHIKILKDFIEKEKHNAIKKDKPMGLEVVKVIQPPTLEPEVPAYAQQIIDWCKTIPLLHEAAPKILRKLLAGRNVLLVGDAGCGKSYLAKQIPDLLSQMLGFKLAFHDMVVGPNFSEFDYLAKAMPAASQEGEAGSLQIVRSPLMTAFMLGYSVAFVDEIAAAQAEVNLALNGMLASRRQFDPASGETIECGDNFFFLAADNTDLTGPTPEYPTRIQQDDAFISRFLGSRIRLSYDLRLEKQLMDPRVFKLIQSLRKKIKDKKIRVELSTRLGVSITQQIKCNLFTFEEAVGDWARELPKSVQLALEINDKFGDDDIDTSGLEI